ncbi:MAG: ribosome maturation factor RimM [Anaerolineae bacterium]
MGRIGRAHGLAGEVRVHVLTDFPGRRFAAGAAVVLGRGGAPPELDAIVEGTRQGTRTLLVRLDLASDRGSAQSLAGYTIFIPTTDAAELPDGEYFEHQLVGLEVALEDGAPIGRVASLMETGTADVLVISGPEGDRLVPMTKEVVLDIDLSRGRMVIRPLPGLLD